MSKEGASSQPESSLPLCLEDSELNSDISFGYQELVVDKSNDNSNDNDENKRKSHRRGRTASTVVRLQQQGFRSTRRSSLFLLQSILPGSVQWNELLAPFVPHLAFFNVSSRSFASDTIARDVCFRPYSCQGALLFVDLSGYSKVTNLLQHRGAHVLSSVVNAYLSRLLTIITRNSGDVLKFAGDALLVCWDGDAQELEVNVWLAAQTAMQLQQQAGRHAIEGHSNLEFRIHCAISCGLITSELFAAPLDTQFMQRLYHFCGGSAVEEIGTLVDLAKSGEVAVSSSACMYLEGDAVLQDLHHPSGAKLLESLHLEDDPQSHRLMQWKILNTKELHDKLRSQHLNLADDFIHPNVRAFLQHGGLVSPTHIAQMRNLVVLFIAQTSRGRSVNWLTEVQTILDKNRAPIVQIILDDKGVHIVAAVNLYLAVPEAALVGLEVCRELMHKKVGTATGVAMGPTFCGVTGSSDACRWDITGAPVVRAARLMQYALKKKVHFAIDESVYVDSMAATRMHVLEHHVTLKGTKHPIPVYTLSDSTTLAAFRILDPAHGSVHEEKVHEIHQHVRSNSRSAVLITGIPLAGMRIVCQRVAGYANLVPYMHLSDVSAGFLQLANTIATWFRYVDNDRVQQLAKQVQDEMKANCWSAAHDTCVQLVHTALKKGYQACFVIHRMEEIDKFSLSLIQECLLEPVLEGAGYKESGSSNGRICFLCNHTPLYGSQKASDIVEEIVLNQSGMTIPTVVLGECTYDELRRLVRDVFDMEVDDRCLDAYAEAAGFSAHYFVERAQAVEKLAISCLRDGVPGLVEMNENLVLTIPPGLVQKNKDLSVSAILPEVAMRFAQIFDDIPVSSQMVVKIVTVGTKGGFFRLPYQVLWETINDILSSGIDREELTVICEELSDCGILKITKEYGESVHDLSIISDEEKEQRCFLIQSPALADIALDVCTPVQLENIATVLIARLQDSSRNDFRVSMVVASLHDLLGNESDAKVKWKLSHSLFRESHKMSIRYEKEKILELLNDLVSENGYSPKEVLGSDFKRSGVRIRPLPKNTAILKTCSVPIALGPMGLSLSVICRNTFHEYGIMSGTYSGAQAASIQSDTTSACSRYMMQALELENYLTEWGLGEDGSDVQLEMELISELTRPAGSSECVEEKASKILGDLFPNIIRRRLDRLSQLVALIRTTEGLPSFLESPENRTLRRAYEALQVKKSRMDAAQDALMILASSNWKAPSIPEYLPLVRQQTIANIRNATLRRRDETEEIVAQLGVDDLEIFLIVTPLLQMASMNGLKEC